MEKYGHKTNLANFIYQEMQVKVENSELHGYDLTDAIDALRRLKSEIEKDSPDERRVSRLIRYIHNILGVE